MFLYTTLAVISCHPVAVFDGDTFVCLTDQNQQVRVRLQQIDAPEKNQAFGQQAKKALSNLIWGKTLSVRMSDTDQYGRTLGTVYLGDLNINQAIVERGYAWAYKQYLLTQDRDKYLQLEQSARSAKRGLWADPAPIYPSDFRHSRSNSSK